MKKTPPEMVPDLSLKLEDKERDAIKQSRSLVHVDNDLVEWLDKAIETGVLVFKPFERKTRARSLATLAGRILKTSRGAARDLHRLSELVLATSPVMFTDLRSVTRESDLVKTEVRIHMESNHRNSPNVPWLVFGQGQLRTDLNPPELRAYLPAGVTDFEHDSAWALHLPLVDVKFEGVDYHSTRVTAIVAPHALEDFKVPWPGYNPMEHPDTIECNDPCKDDPHPMVDLYVPYNDADLYREVEGRRVEIIFGPARPPEEEEEETT